MPARIPPARIPLLDDCSADSRVIAMLSPGDATQVHSSLSGDGEICYAVTATVNGESVNGHVLGDRLEAVRQFEQERKQISSAPPRPASAPEATPAPEARPAPRLPVFGNFSGLDVKRRSFDLANINGKLILVCLWSPHNQDSARELLAVNRLYGQFHRQGLDAVAVSLDGQRAKLLDTLDDFNMTFPNVPDSFGLADREGISSDSIPYTFILNQQHQILAAGLHGQKLEGAVQKLMAAR